MFKKLILVSVLIFAPLSVYAEDAQTITPADTANSQALGPANTDPAGPGTGAAQMLQPSSPTTLQSLQGADAASGGIPSATTNNDLQSAGGQTQFKDFAGLAADPTLKLAAEPENHTAAWVIVLLSLAAITSYLSRLQYLSQRGKS